MNDRVTAEVKRHILAFDIERSVLEFGVRFVVEYIAGKVIAFPVLNKLHGAVVHYRRHPCVSEGEHLGSLAVCRYLGNGEVFERIFYFVISLYNIARCAEVDLHILHDGILQAVLCIEVNRAVVVVILGKLVLRKQSGDKVCKEQCILLDRHFVEDLAVRFYESGVVVIRIAHLGKFKILTEGGLTLHTCLTVNDQSA